MVNTKIFLVKPIFWKDGLSGLCGYVASHYKIYNMLTVFQTTWFYIGKKLLYFTTPWMSHLSFCEYIPVYPVFTTSRPRPNLLAS